MVMFFTQILEVLFCPPKNENFSDKFYSIYKRFLFPAALTSALVIHLQIIWLLGCFAKNNSVWYDAMSYMNLLRNLKMRILLAYFTQLISVSNINYLNKLVLTLATCSLKNISIHSLDKFVEVSWRNNHDKCSTHKTKIIKWPPFSDLQVWFLKYDHIPDNSNSSIVLYSNIYKVHFHLIHSLIFKIVWIRCKKNGINIDASFHMTVNKNSVHHRGQFPF